MDNSLSNLELRFMLKDMAKMLKVSVEELPDAVEALVKKTEQAERKVVELKDAR